MQQDGAERTPAQGGWIVTSSSVQGDEGVRWVSLSFYAEPDLDADADADDASGSWPRDPSISSKTSRLRRRA